MPDIGSRLVTLMLSYPVAYQAEDRIHEARECKSSFIIREEHLEGGVPGAALRNAGTGTDGCLSVRLVMVRGRREYLEVCTL